MVATAKKNYPLKEMMPTLMEKIRETFIKDGFHIPLVFAMTGNELKMICPVFNDGEDKEKFSLMLRGMAKNGMTEMIFVMESWTCPPSKGKEAMEWASNHDGSIEDFPHKTEAVTLTYQRKGYGELRQAEIRRDGDPDKPDLGPWSRIGDGSETAVGRFANIFED